MAQLTSVVEAVRSALATPSTCLPTTSATLQGLLHDTNTKPTKPAAAKASAVRKAAPPRAARNAPPDATKALSSQDRYRLATDVVNVSLRALTDSLKASPSKKASSSGLTVVAECARLAFSYLRAARPSTDASLQLETGMLALSGKLIAHGLDTLAMKELRILKACLQQKANGAKPPPASDKETLASLLHLDCHTSDIDILSLAISYHQNVLRLIVNSGRPATVEAAVDHLDLDNHVSPASLILQSVEHSSDKTKAVRQLDSLAKLMLNMCPSSSSSVDQAAQSHKMHASPDAVFKLQTAALLVQTKWWHLAGHKPNLDKELYDPLLHYLDAYRRRANTHGTEVYKLALDRLSALVAMDELNPTAPSPSFAIYKSLSLLAESLGMHEEASNFTDRMSSASINAPCSALRHLLCTVRSMALRLDHDDQVGVQSTRTQMESCRSDLESIPNEASTFLDDLLVDIAKLRKTTIKRLTVISAKQDGSTLNDNDVELCELALFCTDILVWYFRRIPKTITSKGVAPKLIAPFVSSSLFTCKILSSPSCDHVGMIQKSLRDCCFLADTLEDSEAQHLFVTISNLYWRCFQLLTSQTAEKPTSQAIQCLQASVDVLRNRAPLEQESGFLAVKLERLGSLADSCSAFADSIRVQLRSGVLSNVKDINQSLWARSPETHPKVEILRRNLREYHIALVKQDEDFTFYDDTQLDSLQRAMLLDIQLQSLEEDLFKPSRRRRVTPDLQEICTRMLEIYNPSIFPLRRARLCTRILKYAKEYQGLVNTKILKEALDCRIDHESLGSDQNIEHYASYLEMSLSMAQAIQSEPVSTERISEILGDMSSVVESLVTWDSLESRIDDIDAFTSELRMTAALMAMRGHDDPKLKALQMVARFYSLQPSRAPSDTIQSLAELALQYLHMGYSLEACRILEQGEAHSKLAGVSTLARVGWQLANAETWISIGKNDQAANFIASATEIMRSFPIVEDSMKYHAQQTRAHFAYVFSLYSRSIGLIKEAMIHAKRYVALSQQTMAFLERQHGPQGESQSSPKPELELVRAVDNLTISETKSSPPSDIRDQTRSGAAFWIIVPDLLRSFLHLSDTYAHQGMRVEALYYLDQADKLAATIDAPELRTKVSVQREAQAYIEGVDSANCMDEDCTGDSIDLVRLGITRGDIYAADVDTWESAQSEYEKAELMATRLANKSFNDRIQALQQAKVKAPVAKPVPVRNTKRTATKTPQTSKSKPPTAAKSTVAKSKVAVASLANSSPENIPLASLCAAALRQRGLLLMNQGQTDLGLELLEKADIMKHDPVQEILQQIAMAEGLILKFGDELALDFTFNVLPESTISYPALLNTTAKKSAPQQSLSSSPLAPKKGSGQKRVTDEFTSFLCEAQERILSVQHRTSNLASMSVFHQMCGLGSKAMLLLSAINAGVSPSATLHPTRAACSIEMPRIEALSRELRTMDAEKGYNSHDLAVQYPSLVQEPVNHLSASRFQKDYIDVLPSTWTAVSLTLSEDLTELYITKYRAKQAPFLLRLPMTRNRMQDLEEDEESPTFDFVSGKAELQEIIELSNYSCSKPPSVMSKEAKQSWWDEREALDLRTHELLVNIENIWLGGFRGALSQHRKDPGLLARFRKSFENILDRHLPSRQGTKSKSKKLVLDVNILELFVGLGDDQDGEVDMDEQVLDLLYFVIDVLQFNGERNAYDEVDFDSMATETLDALRSYHEAAVVNEADQNHLILILDRKLHTFPWESMPCLQGVSVSRVGSMLTLRERILTMRRQMGDKTEERYTVNRNSGTSILNPSGDLSRTQATMGPLLDSLAETKSSAWQSIANRAPAEKEFANALSDKSMMLYFGHGSGNQYIRNRTVKKLDKCSEVVWLMGCSSGTVAEYGNFEPTSVPLSYLVAGTRCEEKLDDEATTQSNEAREGLCMAVVATLWDVTDKDIDRFSVRLGEHWGLWSSSPSSTRDVMPKTPRKRGRSVPKTPSKTPSRTPARSRSRAVFMDEDETDRKKSLVEAVAKSRDVCNLRYLNGAATVVYGVPVYLGD